jgi:thiol-disulfide isomerase/thioredoxin
LIATLLLAITTAGPPSPAGPWRAALDLSGGTLRFSLQLEAEASGWKGSLCNGPACQPLSLVRVARDSIRLEMGDYAATIEAHWRADSLIGFYHNVGNHGPRVIPFRAARGRWPTVQAPPALIGQWDATWLSDWSASPRLLEFREGTDGLEGTVISNSGDYGLFAGSIEGDSISLAHFDGSFVYLLTFRQSGDTLRGTFHAGLRGETRWIATRSTGLPHLTPPTEVTKVPTDVPFTFAFPDLEGRTVTNLDPRFTGKVVIVDLFGTWCPTCQDQAPMLVSFCETYRDSGLAVVGLAYEVSGDSSIDAPLVRRYRDKYGITFPLLLAGRNVAESQAETQPQLENFTAFPTTLLIDRQGRVRRIYAGFYGPATGERHNALVREIRAEVEKLLRD